MPEFVQVYGHPWEAGKYTRHEIDLLAWRLKKVPEGFWHIANDYWGPKSSPERRGKLAPAKFSRNPWADWMLTEAMANQYLAVSGCASSGKTTFFAAYALLKWLSSPLDTKVLVTSTSLKESRKRIWGSIRELYLGSESKFPGKLVDSQGKIVLTKEEYPAASDKIGIELIAGDPSKEKEAVGRIIGIKARHVIMIADELPELSPALLEAFYGNLTSNKYSQLIGLGNFASLYDPFGMFCTPAKGWGSVDIESESWETECYGHKGRCIRLDGFKSPNVQLAEDRYPGLYGLRQLESHRKLGENTAAFWRMCRSFPAPSGEQWTIFSDAEFLRGKVHEDIQWLHAPTRVAGFDPSFTTGGDDSVVSIGEWGQCTDGVWRLRYVKSHLIREDVTKHNEPAAFQKAKAFKALCEREGVAPKNAGVDVTGAGIAFYDIIAQVWSNEVLRVNFGGASSDLQATADDERTGRETYANRVSELWYSLLEFVRSDQVRNLSKTAAKEFRERRYRTSKVAGNVRIHVETKTDMKARLGKSPDYADADVITLAVCRERLGAVAGGYGTSPRAATREEWSRVAKIADDVYDVEAIGDQDSYSYVGDVDA